MFDELVVYLKVGKWMFYWFVVYGEILVFKVGGMWWFF